MSGKKRLRYDQCINLIHEWGPLTGNRRHFPPAQLAGMKVVVNAAKRLEFILLGFEDDSSRQELGVELSADNPRILR